MPKEKKLFLDSSVIKYLSRDKLPEVVVDILHNIILDNLDGDLILKIPTVKVVKFDEDTISYRSMTAVELFERINKPVDTVVSMLIVLKRDIRDIVCCEFKRQLIKKVFA